MKSPDALKRYREKRDFSVTPEPATRGKAHPNALEFVVQKHWASSLHYDFRLELDGVMKSWAVPKGPSLDPGDKRMAMHVEDHPISYNTFEGQIPEGQYGAGRVIVWDAGTWVPLQDAQAGYREGKLKFELHGRKLKGRWALVRMRGRQPKQDPWLLIKERDDLARPASEFSVGVGAPDAVRAGLPATMTPTLATLRDKPPNDPENWIFEMKFDGYRLLVRINQRVRLFTRNGHDWTARLPTLARALTSMKLKPGWLDGEIVVLDEQGRPDFQRLQNAFDTADTSEIVYFLFDLPHYAGKDLTRVGLQQRRSLLQALLRSPPDCIRFSETFDAPVEQLLASACKAGVEGLIGKRKESLYPSRRSPDWIKLKCRQRQEFVVGGWTAPKGSRKGFGSLLLGTYDQKGRLVYAGKVGTGFDESLLGQLSGRLEKLATATSPFHGKAGEERTAHWVTPKMVAEVGFSERTRSGHLRHPVFHALKKDSKAASTRPDDLVKVTHPDRVIDTGSGATKQDVVTYYGQVAELMMVHLHARPVAFLRAPQGVGTPGFFQKHMDKPGFDGIKALSQSLDPGHEPLMEVASPLGLQSAAQMNVLEFHTWNAVKTRIDRPDRMTFDLDPGEGVKWPAIREAAELMRATLEHLGLIAFLKTSGGKGLHVVTPIRAQHDWDTVKDLSARIVQHMASTLPQLLVAKSGPSNRIGRIFIDYLRNGFGATTVCAWSLRARPGLGVSVPLRWSELTRVQSSAHWNLANIHTRLKVGNKPWEKYSTSARSLAPALRLLGKPPKPGRSPRTPSTP